MSPNESQLRAALRDGEGDSPDVNALISHALDVRHDRRRRITAIAGGVAAVAVVGVGTTLLVALARNGSDQGASSTNAGGRAPAGSFGRASEHDKAAKESAADAQLRAASSSASAVKLSCPATPERMLLPGGGGSGQFGSTGPLFSGAPAAMKVCAYPLPARAPTRSVVVSGSAASGLAKTLEAEPATRSATSCPANTDSIGGTIEVLAVNARGTTLKPVVITIGCPSQATNGTAVRYVTNLPGSLVNLLAVTATNSIPNPSPGQDHGSPVR